MNDRYRQSAGKPKKPRGKPVPARKERKRRSRSSRVTISPRIRFQILQRDQFMCRYCGGRAPEVALQVDHIIAVANGGRNAHENLVTACFSCNSGKSDIPLSAAGLMQAGRLDDLRPPAVSGCSSDSEEFLQHLSAQHIRLNVGNVFTAFSINEIVKAISVRDPDDEPLAHEGKLALARIGIKVDVGAIDIANRSRDLAVLLRGTKWELGWREPLRMIKGSTASKKPLYFAPGVFSRATNVPLNAFWALVA